MIDLHAINQAIHDTLKQVAPDDLRFVVVMWDGEQQAISSNELDACKVRAMLKFAAKVVETTNPDSYRVDDEWVGHA